MVRVQVALFGTADLDVAGIRICSNRSVAKSGRAKILELLFWTGNTD